MSVLPRISVITPSFNQGAYLEQTIRSVLEQGYADMEYLIVDGGSNDESVEIIRRYESRITHWESQPDRGQSHAINKGFARATGDILCWINSDDTLAPGALHAVGEQFRRNPECQWLVGHCRMMAPDGTARNVIGPDVRGLDAMVHYWRGYMIPQPSTFWRRHLTPNPVLKEDLHYAMDFELWLRLATLRLPDVVPEVLSNYREHDDTKSERHTREFAFEHRRILRSMWWKAGTAHGLQCEVTWRRYHAWRWCKKAYNLLGSRETDRARSLLAGTFACYPPALFWPLAIRSMNAMGRQYVRRWI